MIRTVLMLAILGLVAAALGCQQWQLPSNAEVEQVFEAAQPERMLAQPDPSNVPVFDTRKTEDWHALCNQCHRGPDYSSHTLINWGHRPGCISGSSCVACHGEKLHRMNVRGNKQVCFDCHIVKRIATGCNTCHVAGWKVQHQPHGPEYVAAHSAAAKASSQPCFTCHGSENWCTSCHGLTMPHPDNIRATHPGLVRGKPETCAKCHGAKSCETCHAAKGVVLR